MKAAAIILIVLCLAALTGTVFLYLSSNLTVEGTGCIATDAATQRDYFDQIAAARSSGTFVGTQFTDAALGPAEDYQFYTYTVRLKNNTFLNADIVELQVSPMGSDILQLGDSEPHTLKAHAVGDLQATVLTAKNMHNVRELTVSYHTWGLPFTQKVTYSH